MDLWLRVPLSLRDSVENAKKRYHGKAPLIHNDLEHFCPSRDTLKDYICDNLNGKVGIRYDSNDGLPSRTTQWWNTPQQKHSPPCRKWIGSNDWWF